MTAPPNMEAPESAATDRAQESEAANPRSVDRPFIDLQARLALKGFELHRTPGGVFIVARWNLHKVIDALDQVEHFARQLGA